MKAILMAAGRGTRISRAISDKCKCTLDIGGISLIRHTVQMLVKRNIEVHIVVGYNKEHVFKELADLPVVFHTNIFYSVTNSMASLWFAKDALDGDCVILGNADVFWEEELLDVLYNERRDCVMLCDSNRVEQGDYLFNVKDGKLVAFGKGMNCKNANAEYVGLAVIRGDMVFRCKERLNELIEKQHAQDWWEQVLYSMIPECPIWVEDVAGKFWAEIDFIEDYYRIINFREGRNEE